METTEAPTRTIKILVSDGREEVVTVPAGPNGNGRGAAHTRAMARMSLRLRGEEVSYQELIDGEWVAYSHGGA